MRTYKTKLYKAVYTCPYCKWVNKRDIHYPEPESFATSARHSLTISSWCNKCGAIHKYELTVKVTNNKAVLKTYEFTCDDVKFEDKVLELID